VHPALHRHGQGEAGRDLGDHDAHGQQDRDVKGVLGVAVVQQRPVVGQADPVGRRDHAVAEQAQDEREHDRHGDEQAHEQHGGQDEQPGEAGLPALVQGGRGPGPAQRYSHRSGSFRVWDRR